MSKKKIRVFKWLFIILSYIGLFAPILVLVCMNWSEYIVQREGFSVSVGGMLACIMIILLMKCGFKRFNELFWSTLLLVTIYCLNSIIQDALPITFCFWLGTVIYKLIEIPASYYKKRLEAYTEEIDRTYAREQVKKELKKQDEIESGRV